jgi:hypothetical protein
LIVARFRVFGWNARRSGRALERPTGITRVGVVGVGEVAFA